jgi:hypothetical protein
MNVLREFSAHTKARNVKCATITLNERTFNLKIGYTLEDKDRFLSHLDIDYDSGFGGQELFGTIWYDDGTWSDRGEYDGSEWWQFNECPKILETLI